MIAKNFVRLGVGVTGYAMIQTTGDSGPAQGSVRLSLRVFGARPIVSYTIGNPANGLTFIGKY